MQLKFFSLPPNTRYPMKCFKFVVVLLTGFASSSCAQSGQLVLTPSSTEATRKLVIRFHEAVNRQDWRALDQMVTPDYRHYVVTSTGFRALSWEAFRKGNEAAHRASPDWKNTPLQIVVEGDRVAVLLIGHGTHVGSFAGEKPTGKSVDLPVTVFHQVRRDRLAADWEVADAAPLLEALTTLPAQVR